MKKVFLTIFIISALILTFLYCDNGTDPVVQKTISEFLPVDNSISGWVIEDNSCFDGVAKNDSVLWVIIDGGADVYIDNGFTEAAFKGYTDGAAEMCAYIYNQTSKNNAIVVFKDDNVAVGKYEPVTIGDTARLDTANQEGYTLDLVKSKYFITVFSDIRNDTYKQNVKDFATYIANQISK